MSKPAVKVIKRDERQTLIAKRRQSNKGRSSQPNARDAVTIISAWVSEFQQRRREETTESLQAVFAVAGNSRP